MDKKSITRTLKSPKFHAKAHLIMTFVWLLLAIPSITIWSNSISWLVFMSVYAIVSSHFASYEATQSEIISKREIEGEFDSLRRGEETIEEFVERTE